MKKTYTLRKASQNDFQLAYDIRKNALGKYVEQTWGWDEVWQLKYHEEDFDVNILSIIEVNGEPAGTLERTEENGVITVSGIYIINKFQNFGIGGDIMREIIDEAELLNKEIRLQVLKVNSGAKKFYEQLGFKEIGENDTHYKMIYEPKSKIK
jgi:ribosomal protein S18 acetylase RimI-like enzyme